MAQIEKGGAAAQAAWNLIDPDAVERIPISLLPDDVGNDVIRTLMLIARSVIRAIAAFSHMSDNDLRANVWQQLAVLPEDNPASECVRVLLTAWDDPELARFVTADMFSNADRADIASEFGALSLRSGFNVHHNRRRATAAILREDPTMARRISARDQLHERANDRK